MKLTDEDRTSMHVLTGSEREDYPHRTLTLNEEWHYCAICDKPVHPAASYLSNTGHVCSQCVLTKMGYKIWIMSSNYRYAPIQRTSRTSSRFPNISNVPKR